MNQWATLWYMGLLFGLIACVYHMGKADGRDEERKEKP